MNNTKNNAERENQEKMPRRSRRVFGAQERCQAVLSIWSERRKPAQVCKELEINWTILNQWQKKALAAMLKAMEPRKNTELDPAPALGPKLEKLLTNESRRVLQASRLEKRLEEIQDATKKK